MFDADKYRRLRRVRAEESAIVTRYARGRQCLQQLLRESLDDPGGAPCGRCSVCTGELPAPGPAPGVPVTVVARAFLTGTDTVLAPRRRWPARPMGPRPR